MKKNKSKTCSKSFMLKKQFEFFFFFKTVQLIFLGSSSPTFKLGYWLGSNQSRVCGYSLQPC